MAQVFLSPGVYNQEQDFSAYASTIGITKLGLVGLTDKGPAFKIIPIATSDQFAATFGGTDINLSLPYVANAFLTQSNQLNVVRILGENGYTNSNAWTITSQAAPIVVFSGVSATATTSDITANIGDTVTIYYNGSTVIGTYLVSSVSTSVNNTNAISAINSGGTQYTALNIGGNVVVTAPIISGSSVNGNSLTVVGSTTGTTWTSGTFIGGQTPIFDLSYNNVPLCVLRSKLNTSLEGFQYNYSTDVFMIPGTATTVNPLAEFVISGISSSLSANPISVSLDETQAHYILNVIGQNPMILTSNDYGLYVEAIYPHYLRQYSNQLTGLGYITGLTQNFSFVTDITATEYTDPYSPATTPWVVSNRVGNNVLQLFQFQTIADGDTASSDIKISIVNIDPVNFIFDVLIRNFNDTDATALQNSYERFRSCSLDPSTPNYIGNQIGTVDGTYPQQSQYVLVNLLYDIPTNVVPAGFQGYELCAVQSGATAIPQTVYKTAYNTVDNVNKAYLGITELAYTQLQPQYNNQVNIFNSVKTIEQDLFIYRGTEPAQVQSMGFHMEDLSHTSLSGSYITNTIGLTITGYTKSQAKFTLVPAGGFDGWEPYYIPTFNDAAANNPSQTDYYNVIQLKAGIDLFSAPEVVSINLFAMPGINYLDNTNSVRYALATIEDRADSLYIIDAPREYDAGLDPVQTVSDLQGTGINSSYAATYWPWIQFLDQSLNKYVWMAPTAQVVQAIALTDNVSYPWFAPAGFTRGVLNVVRADRRLSASDRDTLYVGNINPIATFTQQGVVIFGQKTLQTAQTALDRINVRRLLLQIETLIAASSQVLLFEQDDTTLQDQFKAKVEPILQNIQNNRGLYAFNVVMDATNNTSITEDQNELVGKIQIQPTKTAEFISLTFQVLPTGANFSSY